MLLHNEELVHRDVSEAGNVRWVAPTDSVILYINQIATRDSDRKEMVFLDKSGKQIIDAPDKLSVAEQEDAEKRHQFLQKQIAQNVAELPAPRHDQEEHDTAGTESNQGVQPEVQPELQPEAQPETQPEVQPEEQAEAQPVGDILPHDTPSAQEIMLCESNRTPVMRSAVINMAMHELRRDRISDTSTAPGKSQSRERAPPRDVGKRSRSLERAPSDHVNTRSQSRERAPFDTPTAQGKSQSRERAPVRDVVRPHPVRENGESTAANLLAPNPGCTPLQEQEPIEPSSDSGANLKSQSLERAPSDHLEKYIRRALHARQRGHESFEGNIGRCGETAWPRHTTAARTRRAACLGASKAACLGASKAAT